MRLALLKVAYLMEPDMDGDRLRALVEYVSDQDWTSAELAYAANQLPCDEALDQKIRYGGHLTPADFERVISGARTLAERIKCPLTKEEMEQAIQLEPKLSRSDFSKQRRPHDDERRWLLDDGPLYDVFGLDRQRHDR